MDTPIYDQLAEEMGVHVPYPLDPIAELQPVTEQAHPTLVAEVGGPTTGHDGLAVVDPNMFPSGEAA